MPWTFERIVGPILFTEGPVWTNDTLLFTDLPGSRILRYVPATGECIEVYRDTNEGNGLTLDRQNRLYVCEGGGRQVVRYDPDGTRVPLAQRFAGARLNSPNDVVVDERGRVWFTDPRYSDRSNMELDHESVYRLDPTTAGPWQITRVTFDTTRPNGLAFSLDYHTLYVAETPVHEGNRQLRAYPVNVDGSLGAHRVLHDFGPYSGIDGDTGRIDCTRPGQVDRRGISVVLVVKMPEINSAENLQFTDE
jgi:gluconolactonase